MDHTTVSNATPQNGYHKSIHSIPQSTPTNTPGYAQIYTTTTSDGINTDQQLFYQTGDGNYDVPLTRNFSPVVAASGSSFIAGGLIIKWGSATVSNGGTVTFDTPFPASIFSVVPSITSGLNAGEFIGLVSKTLTGFVVNLGSTIGPIGGIRLVQYIAIGN